MAGADQHDRIERRRYQMSECRRFLRASERLAAGAVVAVPVLVAASILMRRSTVLWLWIAGMLAAGSALFRVYAADAYQRARALRWQPPAARR
ncbi:MAG: hypothetical protein RMJ35_02880 [Phycisphaerales bacterium]|nr:hypothetical protein [Phycisphaerales bacterium]